MMLRSIIRKYVVSTPAMLAEQRKIETDRTELDETTIPAFERVVRELDCLRIQIVTTRIRYEQEMFHKNASPKTR